MLLEAMITATCLTQTSGCSEATSAYYKSNKELQKYVDNAEKMGKRMIDGHEYMLYVATPFYAFASGKPASFKIYKQLMLNVNVREPAIGLQWSY